jgi:DNA-binding transcriptional LysR family regulator
MAAMQAFVLVVDTGSFSAAARRLNVGQPAVSKLIAQLEERLGVKLLVRTTRGLTATEAGLNYYERARRSIMEADEAEVAARGAGTSLTGKLRIAAAVTFARIHLMPRLPEFLQRHPDLEIDVALDDHNVDLVQEGIDVALRMGRQLADSSLTVRRIASVPVVGTPTYFARAGEPTAPGDLTAHQAVIYDQRSGGADWTLRRDGAEFAVALKGRLRVNAAEGVRAAVLANGGLTIASEWMFAPEIADGTVRVVLQHWKLPRVDLWAVFAAGRTATTKAHAFTQLCRRSDAPRRSIRLPSSSCAERISASSARGSSVRYCARIRSFTASATLGCAKARS